VPQAPFFRLSSARPRFKVQNPPLLPRLNRTGFDSDAIKFAQNEASHSNQPAGATLHASPVKSSEPSPVLRLCGNTIGLPQQGKETQVASGKGQSIFLLAISMADVRQVLEVKTLAKR